MQKFLQAQKWSFFNLILDLRVELSIQLKKGHSLMDKPKLTLNTFKWIKNIEIHLGNALKWSLSPKGLNLQEYNNPHCK